MPHVMMHLQKSMLRMTDVLGLLLIYSDNIKKYNVDEQGNLSCSDSEMKHFDVIVGQNKLVNTFRLGIVSI